MLHQNKYLILHGTPIYGLHLMAKHLPEKNLKNINLIV